MAFYKSVIRKLRTARTFSWHDRRILFQAWVLLLVVDLGLRLLPFRRVQGFLAPRRKDAEPVQASDESATIRHFQKLVEIAARNHLYAMQCLRQSLVLQWLLARRDIATELRFGVRKEASDLRAHAWLEHAGQPIGEPQSVSARYAPLAAVSSQR
jgi:hypothetical protein